MAHFAEVVNGIVRRVIVAEQDFIDSGAVGIPSRWVQTSYNTYGGVHKLGGTPLRKNYAGVGYTYDEQRDAFIPPKPYQSWNLNEDTCLWESPIPYPNDNKPYLWNETTGSWEEVVREEE
jgi:hypothetical protein